MLLTAVICKILSSRYTFSTQLGKYLGVHLLRLYGKTMLSFVRITKLPSKMAIQFCSPLIYLRGPIAHCPSSLDITSFLDFSYPVKCVVVSRYNLKLQFPNDIQC